MSAKRIVIVFGWVVLVFTSSFAQDSGGTKKATTLTVEKIMRDPKWMGTSPGNARWSEDGKWICFMWNPENAESDSLYVVSRNGGTPRKVTLEERKKLPGRMGSTNRAKTLKVYEKDGDLFLLTIKSGTVRQITNTVDRESNSSFTHDEKKIVFMRDNNLYLWQIETGETVQLTDFRRGAERRDTEEPRTDQERWLKKEELRLISVLRERKDRVENARKGRESEEPERPKAIYTQDKRVTNVRLSPDERYITFGLSQEGKNAKQTMVPNYVHESGFTQDIHGRTKVGSPQGTYEFCIYATKRDTVLIVSTDDIPGIYDEPVYLKAYGKESQKEDTTGNETMKKREKKKPREVMMAGPVWSDDGRRAVVSVFSMDNKDRWIMLLEPDSAKLVLLDRQHDDAWIGGPGIRAWWGGSSVGWMPDNRRIWFQSEETGYSHLYTVDMLTGEKRALTKGKFEVYSPEMSRNNKSWYFTSNEVHPGERHFCRMPVEGGKAVRITTMTGSNEVSLSPDEKMLAIRHSTSNRPWELFVMPNTPGAEARQVTQSLSEEFRSYAWRDPEVLTFTARDGAEVYARLYRPKNPIPNGPAVIFVHGAGYLQNAHKWWSSYFREYMFNNLLADKGYTVLDIDYRASSGYGRDWRTDIYRFMGGKDLSDQVDGAKFLVENYGVDPKRIGIYGGSYGGFITLMAMFTEPDVFAAGAALRPVTDWAHYNHGYTSDILNVPYADSLAYVRSSPIYHAEGLKGALLMCHGMVDVNVHFQDVVRLAQRLIELGKENWEFAVYPVEGHGFREPSSWTDEYKRIFKLFEDNLKK
ncbi:MAG: prolyl oligopeptidase family serine peptidase [bacterium]